MGRKKHSPPPNPTPPPHPPIGALLRLADVPGLPVLLRAHGTVHSCVAAVLTDPAARARQHQAALLAARRAIDLAPDSVELAQFCALLLYEAASDNRAYEEVIAECERGLRIDDPSDPEPHSLKLPTPDPDQLWAELRNCASALLQLARHRASSPPVGRLPNPPELGAQSALEGHG
ncbi:uncharacterized protein LOC125520645 [Triticum urartu]|uniref:uncharacterized protein LOC125520645 n=1 Tax=Triticum urartu TaxID=4572 RepID=UPI002043C887|nr:uncharacterized protein LOC125520645 [Triticum urartu]